MKSKKFNKSLQLNKTTVANLGNKAMITAKGGVLPETLERCTAQYEWSCTCPPTKPCPLYTVETELLECDL